MKYDCIKGYHGMFDSTPKEVKDKMFTTVLRLETIGRRRGKHEGVCY